MSTRTHKSMLKSGKVSIWVGNIRSEDELLAYVDDGGFGSDFDFQVKPELGRELRAESKCVPLQQLVHGFSSWSSFVAPCVTRGEELYISAANCMVVLYAMEYIPSPKNNPNSPLAFLGVFDF